MIRKLLRKKRISESWFKYIMSVSHLWLGLFSSLVLILVCITGSIYAFRQPLEDAFNDELLYVDDAGSKASLDTIRSDFEKRFDQAKQMQIHANPHRSIWITSSVKEDTGNSAYYNPYSGQMLGTSNKTITSFLNIVLGLHRFLLADEGGKLVVGCSVLVFLYMLLSGFVLWLPRKLKNLRDGFCIRFNARFYRLNYDLHKVLGFYSLVFLFFIALTGLYVSFHWMKNVIVVSLGGNSIVISDENAALNNELAGSFTELFSKLQLEQQVELVQVSVDTLVITSDSIFAVAGLCSINLPTETLNAYRVTKWHSSSWGLIVPEVIEFSAHGKIRAITTFSSLTLHEQFQSIAKSLHTGEVFGLTGIIFYAIVSLAGSSLPVTGFIIWIKKQS